MNSPLSSILRRAFKPYSVFNVLAHSLNFAEYSEWWPVRPGLGKAFFIKPQAFAKPVCEVLKFDLSLIWEYDNESG